MARNDVRRAALADAGIRVLAREGARGLTHRAVDAEAGTPRGTSSNYFASRDALVEGLVARIGERLTPDPAVQASLAAQQPGAAVYVAYVRDIVRRLLAEREAAIALLELRLESTRRPAVAAALERWYRAAFEADVAFTDAEGLPGGRREIALLHYAIDGLLLDVLTVRVDASVAPDEAVEQLVERLLREP